MREKPLLPLAVALLMFPQLAQTLFSPALADLALNLAVPPRVASQVLTVYFLAFALGVVAWGWLSDRLGRRKALLSGLAVYATGTALTLFVTTFEAVLALQALAAFGAAAGSVVTQTILRDRFTGTALASAFSLATMILALSPAVGLLAGTALVDLFGYRGVFCCLLVLALALFAWALRSLPETRPREAMPVSLVHTLQLLVREPQVWRSALLVAVFNVAMYSYYALGPFLFTDLGVSELMYGLSGILLALGAMLGAWINRRLVRTGRKPQEILALGVMLALGGGIGVEQTQHTVWFVAPMVLVVIAFGLAIPNVLGQALAAFGDRLGTASALFGLLYYLMIGIGMLLAGWTQALGSSLIMCGYQAAWVGLLWKAGTRPRVAARSG